jgi:TonB-linked SusC/RagA family outer membrane protein
MKFFEISKKHYSCFSKKNLHLIAYVLLIHFLPINHIIAQTNADQVEKIQVTGIVSDSKTKEPIIGVTINIKGTTHGAITDINGKFTIEALPTSVLAFSFLGYETAEVPIAGRSVIDYNMTPSVYGIDEVVVTAIGIERETRGLGYAVSTLNNEEISATGSPTLATSLAGKIPGLNLTKSTGVMGTSRIVLRGEASLDLSKNQALIVIDGVPMNNQLESDGERSYLGAVVDYGDGLSAINPQDIESVTVLKGASAAALYGSQAANGAIMITTKSGKYDQALKVTLRHSTSFQQVNRWLPRQLEFGSGNRSENDYYAFKDSPDGSQNRNSHSWGPKFMGQNFYQYDSPHTAVYDPNRREEMWEFTEGGQTPWISREVEQNFYEIGTTHSTGVSIDAGNNNAYFRGSVDRLTNKYIMPNTGYERLNFMISSGVRTNKTMLSSKIQFINQTSDNLPAEGYDRQNAHYQVFWLNANDNLQWFKDNYWFKGQEDVMHDKVTALSANPYWILYNSINTLDKTKILANAQLDHSITNNLSLIARTGLDLSNEFRTRERAWSEPRNRYGKYSEHTIKSTLINTDILINQQIRGNTFEMTVSGGFNHFYEYGNGMYSELNGLKIPGVFNLENVDTDLPTVKASRPSQMKVGVFGLINASFKEILFMDITGRNDWNSTLDKEHNSYFYPSVSLAFDATNGLNIKSKELSYLKLRASYASVGSGTKPFAINRYYNSSDKIIGGYSNQSVITRRDIKPERTDSWEIGFNLHTFDHRIRFDATYYNAVTKDQIMEMNIDPASGYERALMNAGTISNSGVEIQLNGSPIRRADLGWEIALNWHTNKNKVLELADGLDSYILSSFVGNRVIVKAEPGEELGKIYGKGYDKHNGQIIFENGLAARDNEEDYLGNVFPEWNAGLTNSFRYKNISMSFQFDYQHGGNAYSITHFLMNYTGKSTKTVYGRESGAPIDQTMENPGAEYDMASGSWLQNNEGRFGVIGDGLMYDENTGKYVKNTVSAAAPYYYNSMYERDQIEGNIHETTFLKLRHLRIDYTLGSFWNIQSATVGIFGNELFVWTNFPSYDPETSVANNGLLTPGLEAMGSPSTRSFGVDIKLTF